MLQPEPANRFDSYEALIHELTSALALLHSPEEEIAAAHLAAAHHEPRDDTRSSMDADDQLANRSGMAIKVIATVAAFLLLGVAIWFMLSGDDGSDIQPPLAQGPGTDHVEPDPPGSDPAHQTNEPVEPVEPIAVPPKKEDPVTTDPDPKTGTETTTPPAQPEPEPKPNPEKPDPPIKPAPTNKAHAITINNPSFEVDDIDDGAFVSASPTGWSFAGARNSGGYKDRNADALGDLFKTKIDATPDPSDREQLAFSNGAHFYQVLATVLAPTNTYTITVEVGDRTDHEFPTVQLRVGTGTKFGANLLKPIAISNTTPTNGSEPTDGWQTWTTTFTTGSGVTGQPLRVELVVGGVQALFDNVRLTTNTAEDATTPIVTEPVIHIPGQLAHFAFDENKGNVVADSVDPKRKGSIRGTPVWARGREDASGGGSALQLENNTYVELPGAAGAPGAPGVGDFERTDAFSYGCWLKPKSTQSGALIARMGTAHKHRGWDVLLEKGYVAAHLVHRWPGDLIKVTTMQQIPLNKWTHVFVTYDGSSKAAGLKVYINGKPADVKVGDDSLRNTIKTTVPLTIGRRYERFPYQGLIDDVRIFGGALSPDQLALLMKDAATMLARSGDPVKPDPVKPDPDKPDPDKPNPDKPNPDKPKQLFVYFMNIGGETYKDNTGRVWQKGAAWRDGGHGWQGGKAAKVANKNLVIGSAVTDLQTVRFTVPPGKYRVTLVICDHWANAPGQRTFDISVEGKRVLKGFDPFGSQRTKSYVFAETFRNPVPVVDGQLDIEFKGKAAIISGIGIEQVSFLNPSQSTIAKGADTKPIAPGEPTETPDDVARKQQERREALATRALNAAKGLIETDALVGFESLEKLIRIYRDTGAAQEAAKIIDAIKEDPSRYRSIRKARKERDAKKELAICKQYIALKKLDLAYDALRKLVAEYHFTSVASEAVQLRDDVKKRLDRGE